MTSMKVKRTETSKRMWKKEIAQTLKKRDYYEEIVSSMKKKEHNTNSSEVWFNHLHLNTFVLKTDLLYITLQWLPPPECMKLAIECESPN